MSTKISLCLMVKNEEDCIIKTLDSCKNLINTLFLHDTGSTDTTIKLAKKFCLDNNIKFILLQSEFQDFSASRNKLLDLVEQHIPPDSFYMILDANDEIRTSWNFTIHLDKIPLGNDLVMVNSVWKNDNGGIIEHAHKKIFLLRSGRNIRYERYVHEYLTINGRKLEPEDYFTISEVSIFQDRTTETIKTRKRYALDAVLLKKDFEDHGLDDMCAHRTLFYLGRTYLNMGRLEEARDSFELMFKHRFKFEALEDRYMSRIYLAQTLSELKHPWKDQLYYLTEAYEMIPDKIEALIIIVSKFAQLKQWNTAYMYAKIACDISYDESKFISSNLSDYKIRRWYLLSYICYNLGNFQEGAEALTKVQDKQSVENIKHLFYPLGEQEEIILVFGGFSYGKWNGNMINGIRGLGGAETVISYISSLLMKKLNKKVVVCCDTDEAVVFDQVLFFPISMYEKVAQVYKIDKLIVFRYSTFLRYYQNIKDVYLILEDVFPVSDQVGKFEIECNPKLKRIICKTNWHKECLSEVITNIDGNHDLISKICVSGNAITTERFNVKVEKKPWRFIYSSCPTRGAWNLVRLIPKIRKIIPEAEFHFFMTFKCPFYQPSHRIPELKVELEKLDVFLNERISQEQLAIEMLKSDIWLYPTTFRETYCITALEMQAAKVLCIYTNFSCLNETVGDRGILIKGDPYNETTDKQILSVINDIKAKKIDKQDYLDRGYQWAMEQTWDNRVEELIRLL